MPVGAILSLLGARLGKISPKVWLAIGCAVALLLGALWHHHEVSKTIATAKAEQKAADQKALDAETAKITTANQTIAQLTQTIKDQTNAKISNNAADAGTLRVLGPGKATCSPRLPASPGGHAPAAKPDAAGPALPSADFAAVPWPWLVARAQEHDDLLAEDRAWRDWYAKVVAAWPKK